MKDDSMLIREAHDDYGDYLAKCRPEDFDGHSEFPAYTPRQRLEWLARAADVVRSFKGLANG